MPKKGIDWEKAGEIGEAAAVDRFFAGGNARIRAGILIGLAVGIFFFPLFRAYFGSLSFRVELSFYFCMLITYTFLAFPLGKRRWHEAFTWHFVVDLVLIAILIGSEAYILFDELVQHTQSLSLVVFSQAIKVDYIIGALMCLILIEASRRTIGWVVSSLPVIFMFYAFFANHFPGFLRNPPIDWQLFMDMVFMEQSGLWGIGIQVLLNMLILFLLFGALLSQTRTGAVFIATAQAIMGNARGGPAKVAVGASALMGTMSGSAIANVATTGAITIPMMKDTGYRPIDAAAIESCASNGGQIMPPIMGASAFLISIYLGIAYRSLVLYALIPAVLYFLSIFMMVHFKAVKLGLKGTPKAELPSLRQTILEGGHMTIPIIIFLYLLFMGYSVTMVGFWGVLLVIVLSFVRKETRMKPLDFLKVIDRSVRTVMPIAVACVLVGLLIGTINVSGLGIKMSTLVVHLSMGNIFLALLLSAILAVILGMGMPTVLVYAALYLFVIPALVKMGVNPLSAHLFAFYYGIVSGITPPVSLVAFTGAGIAGTPPMRTGFAAAKMGVCSYILPFLFVLFPSVLIKDAPSVMSIVLAVAACCVIVVFFTAAVEGFLVRDMNMAERLLAVGGVVGIAFANQGYILPAIGGSLLVVILAIQILKPRLSAIKLPDKGV